MDSVSFEDLHKSGLRVGCLYKSGTENTTGDDPIAKLVAVGNRGGFRLAGPENHRHLCVLYSTQAERHWPDKIDRSSGTFRYYGDNRDPKKDIHERKGNRFLRDVFEHLRAGRRDQIPPILFFTKRRGGMDVVFEGLCAPGAPGVDDSKYLEVVSKPNEWGIRFQNYSAIFTILDAVELTREWLDSLVGADSEDLESVPEAWRNWVASGEYRVLRSG